MPWFGQEILELAQEKGALTDEAYREALARSRGRARAQLDSLLDAHDLDGARRPDRQPGVAHRPRQRRPLRHVELAARGRLRLSERNGSGGLRATASRSGCRLSGGAGASPS